MWFCIALNLKNKSIEPKGRDPWDALDNENTIAPKNVNDAEIKIKKLFSV